MKKQNTIGFSLRMPANYNPNDNWETLERKAKTHNVVLFNEHNENLKRAKKHMQDITLKLMNATKEPLILQEYEKLERQLNQVKSGFLFALTHDYDPGCSFNGEPDKSIKNAYDRVTSYWKDAVKMIDQHLITLQGLKKRDDKKHPPQENPKYATLKDCFYFENEYQVAIEILRNTTPAIIDHNGNYNAGKRDKASISVWLEWIRNSGDFSFREIENKAIAPLLNKEFPGLNLGVDARTLDGVSVGSRREWLTKIKNAIQQLQLSAQRN